MMPSTGLMTTSLMPSSWAATGHAIGEGGSAQHL
jgi:hypothetical protein